MVTSLRMSVSVYSSSTNCNTEHTHTHRLQAKFQVTWCAASKPKITLNLVYGVSIRPLLLQPISELLVWLVVGWYVEDGGRRNICYKKRKT